LLTRHTGPLYKLPAALEFYRALRVYPSPVELIGIYEKTITPAVFTVRRFPFVPACPADAPGSSWSNWRTWT
jgi:hypothetical protein